MAQRTDCLASCRSLQRLVVRLPGPSDRAQPCRADDVDRHPDRDLARWSQLGRARSLGCCAASSSRAGCAAWPGQIAWMLCGLIRPALPAERGTLDRLVRRRLLHDLDLAAGPAVPSCVRRVLRSHAVGHWPASRLDDAATTSSGWRVGLPIGGGLPAVRLGHAMARPPLPRVSVCHPSEF